MYLQQRISASDSKHVMSSVTIRTPAVNKRTLSGPINNTENLYPQLQYPNCLQLNCYAHPSARVIY